MDVQIGQRVRISDDAFPGSDEAADIAARNAEVTVFASVSDDGCWFVETDEYDLLPVLDTELEAIEVQS